MRKALEAGFAAATILPSAAAPVTVANHSQLRIAFDGDAVLFSDESERIYKREGLDAFQNNELSGSTPWVSRCRSMNDLSGYFGAT